MTGFIDIHCHILPGLDDGPESVEESLEMVEDGFQRWDISYLLHPTRVPGCLRYHDRQYQVGAR